MRFFDERAMTNSTLMRTNSQMGAKMRCQLTLFRRRIIASLDFASKQIAGVNPAMGDQVTRVFGRKLALIAHKRPKKHNQSIH